MKGNKNYQTLPEAASIVMPRDLNIFRIEEHFYKKCQVPSRFTSLVMTVIRTRGKYSRIISSTQKGFAIFKTNWIKKRSNPLFYKKQ